MYTADTVYYPLDEMTTMMIPVVSGCPYNACTFCSMYRDVEYSMVPLSDVEFELAHGNPYAEKLFLTGADPLAIGYERMSAILKLVRRYLPYCARVACYASVRSVSKLTVEQLSDLHNGGLRLLYIGFESGDDRVLRAIHKGHRAEDAVRAARKLNEAHLAFCSIVMYGVAGAGNCVENALRTAELLNQFDTQRVITMNLNIFEDSPLARMVERGEFQPPAHSERLLEVRTLLEHLDPKVPTVFDTTHPTNIINMKGTLPQERDALLARFTVEGQP